jgi:hypothetical protein
MRIRSTKPEFWRSERIASVSWDARLVLKGLESFVDDNGVGRDDLPLIVGDLFQRDLVREPSRTLARVSEAISELAAAGLLHRYEVDGTSLLYVAFWESIQRVDKPQSGRFPRPDGTWNYKDSEIRESVANPRESSRALAPGTGEQGNRGTGEQRGSRKRATQAPDSIDITDTMREWATTKASGVDLDAETERFLDHHRAKGSTFKDWTAAWRTWMSRAASYSSNVRQLPHRDGSSAHAGKRKQAEVRPGVWQDCAPDGVYMGKKTRWV